MSHPSNHLGLAGRIAEKFLKSKLTLLIVIATLLLGVFSVFKTPKEEEPQIKVPMIDVIVAAPGYSPKEIETRVVNIVEREMSSLTKVKHVYSTSLEDVGMITVRFEVGEDLETSLVKVHHRLMGLRDRLPSEAMAPQVKSYTIDDVPFFSLTFHSKSMNSSEIRYKTVPFVKKLQEIDGVSELAYIGGERMVAKITLNLQKMNEMGMTLLELKQAVENSSSQYNITPLRDRTPELILSAGPFVRDVTDIKNIPVGRRFGRMMTLGEVAQVSLTFDSTKSDVSYGKEMSSAFTVTFTKKKGTNASILSEEILKKLNKLVGNGELDSSISYEVTRDYGKTAKEKSDELLEHLIIATVSVMILIALTMGFRVSLVVGIAVPVTLAMTLFVYFIMGYTLNRVTLFALIFSIGILVDDAIVVVENIYRHISKKFHKDKDTAIVKATDEVGNPTILATFTVILAIMPMAFVGGLMGPYMKPIPVGASMAMIFSMFIAFMISPWAARLLIPDHVEEHEHKEGFISKRFRQIMGWTVSKSLNSFIVLGIVTMLLLISISLIFTKSVQVKMLPFDNKSEFQVLIDMPKGSTIDQTKEVAQKITEALFNYKDVKNTQTYVGVAAPFNFSGMVKHTFMRSSSFRADIQVNLLDKHDRKIQSHEFVKQVRNDVLKLFIANPEIDIKFLEIPPGPPVLSTLLAEVYHPNPKTLQVATERLAEIYKSVPGIVETDTTYEDSQKKAYYEFDRVNGMIHGVPQKYAVSTLLMGFGDLNIYPLHAENEEEPVFLRLSLDEKHRSDSQILSMLVPSVEGDKIPLSKLFGLKMKETQNAIYHKDLRPVSYVMAEVAGDIESPFYAILELKQKLGSFETTYTDVPVTSDKPILKWDGEMDITIEVFRDMGVAFAIAIALIMILVIGWYNSFILPWIIIVPVPLTLIGIIPGHWLMGSFFTATSMIGFIAGAGITVRNSIILVDFIEMKRLEGMSVKDAIIESTIVRFRPILLTALAVLVAGVVILFDPIFQGLAISLMAGSIISAILSIPLVPVLYYWLLGSKPVLKKSNH